MEPNDFIRKYKLDVTKFAADCGVSYPAMRAYIAKKRIPRQDVAERMEKVSDGVITVRESRGKDDRDKRRQKDGYERASEAIQCDAPSGLYGHP
jgi:hypothetical protein